MKILLLIPSVLKTGIETEVAQDRHPTMDYYALAAALRRSGKAGESAPEVELLDFAAVDRDRRPAVRLAERIGGKDLALAVLGLLEARRQRCDAIFSNGENVGIPLALLLQSVPKRPRHVTIGHRLSTGKKRLFFRLLHAERAMDTIFLYATLQQEIAEQQLGIPSRKLRRIAFHADSAFFRPKTEVRETLGQVSAAGLEWRDYPTLIAAAERLPAFNFLLAAASPWSKHTNETEKRSLPKNVSASRYSYGELRDLYASSEMVAVPLYENDFQAGVTTLLEAMAMGKAVICTRTTGQTDVIVDGENGLSVAPGDSEGWETALKRLHDDPALRQRLGERARRWIEENATLDLWAETISRAILGEAVSVPLSPKTDAASSVPSDKSRATFSTSRSPRGAT